MSDYIRKTYELTIKDDGKALRLGTSRGQDYGTSFDRAKNESGASSWVQDSQGDIVTVTIGEVSIKISYFNARRS